MDVWFQERKWTSTNNCNHLLEAVLDFVLIMNDFVVEDQRWSEMLMNPRIVLIVQLLLEFIQLNGIRYYN
ncbi:MAG: hypothetical protein U0T81_10445 [Saprospiraceae bacterium]